MDTERHHAKFHADRSCRCWGRAILWFSKMAAVRHIWVLQVWDFNCQYGCRTNMHHRAKFCADKSNRCQDMAVSPCFKMVVVRQLDFLKFKTLTARTLEMANVHHQGKFHADRSSHCGDMAVFRFFKMAAVRHLGFVIRLFGTHKKSKTTPVIFHHLPGCPHWGNQCEFWHAGSYRQCNHPFQILWQSVQGFWSFDTPKFVILYRNSWSPLQQCKHHCATLW